MREKDEALAQGQMEKSEDAHGGGELRHRPFILTLGRHEMADCACVQRIQWGLEVWVEGWGEKGEAAPSPSPSGTRSPHILLLSGKTEGAS